MNMSRWRGGGGETTDASSLLIASTCINRFRVNAPRHFRQGQVGNEYQSATESITIEFSKIKSHGFSSPLTNT